MLHFFFKNPFGHSASNYTEETKRILVDGQVFSFLPTVVSTSHMISFTARHKAQLEVTTNTPVKRMSKQMEVKDNTGRNL
jgi:hypothetical protein